MEEKRLEHLIDSDEDVEIVPNYSENKETKDIDKRFNIKVIDPTLPAIQYKIVKKYDLKPIKKEPVTVLKEVIRYKEPIIPTKKTLPVETIFEPATKEKVLQSQKEFIPTPISAPKRKISAKIITLYIIAIIISLGIFYMAVYSIIDAIVVFSQWNLCVQNNLLGHVTTLPFVEKLAPAYFYQYFFWGDGHIYLGVPTNYRSYSLNTSFFAEQFNNMSVGGFGWVSYFRFINPSFNGDVLSSSLTTQPAWPCIIQIIYSLIGVLLGTLLLTSISFNPNIKKNNGLTIFCLIIGIIWIII